MTRSFLVVLLSGAVLAAADPALSELTRTSAPATPDLRAFGRVATTTVLLRGSAGEATLSEFRSQDADHARTLAGKYIADLDLSPGTRSTPLPNGTPVRTLASGASVLVAVAGATTQVVTASSPEVLASVLAAHPELVRSALDKAEYPAYLDRFDRYGFGFYGLAGYSNRGTVAWDMRDLKPAPKAADINPLDDFAWCVKGNWRFEPWLDPTAFDDSDGIIKNTEVEWQVAKAKEAGLGLSFRLYGTAGGADWAGRRFADLMDQPFSFLTSGWHGRSNSYKSDPHGSWSSLDLQKYMAVKAMALMRTQVAQPNVMGWMHPHGELVHNEWYDKHADRSPLAQRGWRDWLARRCTLAEASRLYDRTARPFGSWDEIPIPEFATFAGLDGSFVDLGGTWWGRAEPAVDPKTPLDALPQPGVDGKW